MSKSHFLFPSFGILENVFKGKLKLSVSPLYGLDICLFVAKPLQGPAGVGA